MVKNYHSERDETVCSYLRRGCPCLMKRLSYVSNRSWFYSLTMTEKPSQATIWSQSNMWSLTYVDNILLTRLPVLGDTRWYCETRNFVCL